MEVKGFVSEVSKKPKSWKLIVDKHNFYCKEDVNFLVGKNIIAEYVVSAPYPNPSDKTKTVTSNYITFNTIKVLDGTQTPAEAPQKPTEAPQKPPEATREPIKAESPIGPDWSLINLRKDRSMCIAYAKDLCCCGKIELSEIINQAERFTRYINIGIPDLTADQEEQVKSEASSDEIPF